jgi:FAD/FMN-containing dehydrogenase
VWGWLRRRRLHLINLAHDVRNVGAYLLSSGRCLLHEGRFDTSRRCWKNWNELVSFEPERLVRPRTEEELRQAIRDAHQVRVVGSGHAFNDSCGTEGHLLSLDAYNQVEAVDELRKVVRVQAGIRLRDLNKRLREHQLALPVLGSTDAQSIAGLLATDLHGTGRQHGFLSEQVLKLWLVNARGDVDVVDRETNPELFHAALGSLGTCGVIMKVELQCEPAFNLEKQTWIAHRDWVEQNLDSILEKNDHVSLYRLGGADVEYLHVNVWNRTTEPITPYLAARKLRAEVLDLLSAGVLPDVVRLLKALDRKLFGRLRPRAGQTRSLEPFTNLGFALLVLLMGVMSDSRLKHYSGQGRCSRWFKLAMYLTWNKSIVHPSSTGFGRRLFYRHDEIEYGVPYENHPRCMKDVLDALSDDGFVTLLEIRFTPDRSRALLGPGVGRRTCYIELAPNASRDVSQAFAHVEQLFLRHGGQVHLGKWTAVNARVMALMYPGRFTRFLRVRQRQDSEGKFMNAFTRRVFGQEEPAQLLDEPDKHAQVS